MVMLNIKHYKLIQMCVERFDFYLYILICDCVQKPKCDLYML